jgi:hypothetical protein
LLSARWDCVGEIVRTYVTEGCHEPSRLVCPKLVLDIESK